MTKIEFSLKRSKIAVLGVKISLPRPVAWVAARFLTGRRDPSNGS